VHLLINNQIKFMNKKLILGGIAAAVLSLGIVGAAWAYQGDSAKKGPNYTPEREAQMSEIMNKGDYAGWKELMAGRGRVSQVVNQDNFSKFAEAWKLEQAGKTAEADTIRQELGLGNGKAGGCSGGCGMKNGSGQGNHGQGFIDANNDGVCDHK
jgi:hypothetical protein